MFIIEVQLCKPALGYAFAAGCVDGAGAFSFTQGTTSGNDFWDLVSTALTEPSEESKKCHAPKPILLPTGEVCLCIYFPCHFPPRNSDQVIPIFRRAVATFASVGLVTSILVAAPVLVTYAIVKERIHLLSELHHRSGLVIPSHVAVHSSHVTDTVQLVPVSSVV